MPLMSPRIVYMRVRLFGLLRRLAHSKVGITALAVAAIVLPVLHKRYVFDSFARAEKANGLFGDNIEQWHDRRRQAILRKYPQVKALERCDNMKGALDTAAMLSLMALKFVGLYLLAYEWDFALPVKVLLVLLLFPALSVVVGQYVHELAHGNVFSRPGLDRAILQATDAVYHGRCAFAKFGDFHGYHHSVAHSGRETDLLTTATVCDERHIGNNWFNKCAYQLSSPLRLGLLYDRVFSAGAGADGGESARIPPLLTVFGHLRNLFLVLYLPEVLGLHVLTELLQFASPLYPSITEHIRLKPGVPTNSYYGVLNRFTHNLYYHKEHHDFPNINSRYHPILRRIAPDYYGEPEIHDRISIFYKILFSPDYTMVRKLR